MHCELDYCIYNQEFLCTVKEARLNSLGMCEDCILVSIPHELLKELKDKQLKDIEIRWVNYDKG